MAGSNSYSRECIECYHEEYFELPKLKKKVIYLDQFVISELIKLLDVSHPSHEKVARGPHGAFWIKLFIALEKASKSQAIVCPDSFYHRDESSTGGIDFRLMQRLYEHFSGGKTLYPSSVIERFQIQHHFSGWLDGKKSTFTFDPLDIAFGQDLNAWEIGMRVSIRNSPRPHELKSLKKVNATTQQQLAMVWQRWQREVVGFEERAKEEVLGLGKGMTQAVRDFLLRRNTAMQKAALDSSYGFDINDMIPPPANEIVDTLVRVAKGKGIPEQELAETIVRYLRDVDALLEVPCLKISSIMFAGLARTATLGEKKVPKSTTDVQFISSYLPYCDAMFVDKQSARLLRELPRGTPSYLRLKEFNTQIFSLNEKEKLLTYLEEIVSQLPSEQIEVLKDVSGDDYADVYWSIIEREKTKITTEDQEETGSTLA